MLTRAALVAWFRLAKAKAANEGVVHMWKDGKLHRKEGEHWVVVPHPVPTHIELSAEDHGWNDHPHRDGAVVAALHGAEGVAGVEHILHGVRHREFAVALGAQGAVQSITGGPLTARSMTDHDNVIAVRARHTTSMPPVGTSTIVVTHNHPGGTPIGGSDIVEAMRSGVGEIRAVAWHGTYSIALKGEPLALSGQDAALVARVLQAMIKDAYDDAFETVPNAEQLQSLTWHPGVDTMSAQAKVIHAVGNGTAKRLNASRDWKRELAEWGFKGHARYEARLGKADRGHGCEASCEVSASRPPGGRGRLGHLEGDHREARRVAALLAIAKAIDPDKYERRWRRMLERRGQVVVEPPQRQRAEFPFQGFVDFQGLPIDIENVAGSYREGVDRDGHKWRVKMHAHYGELRGSEGVDGDPLDIYVGPLAASDLVVVVKQNSPTTGRYDEDKVILGMGSVDDALALYRRQYDRPGFYGGHSVMNIADLRRWAADRDNRGDRVAKASTGPFIGPKGGKWANPEHTIPWHDHLQGNHGEQFTVKGHNAAVAIRVGAERHGEGGPEVKVHEADMPQGGQWIPKSSVRHFHDDLNGVVSGNADKAPHSAIAGVIRGEAKFLGKGDDGLVFKHGDKAVKVSTTVPFQPMNYGHRTPQQAAKMLESQAQTSEHLRKMGVPHIPKAQVHHHGDKAFVIRDYVDLPEKLSRKHLDQAADAVHAMHAKGYALNDEVQVGVRDGEAVLFDTGKAAPIRDNGGPKWDSDQARDKERLKRLFAEHGEKYIDPDGPKKGNPIMTKLAFTRALRGNDVDAMWEAHEANTAAHGGVERDEDLDAVLNAIDRVHGQKAPDERVAKASGEKYAALVSALSALIKAKYKRKIPTGKFRQTKNGKPGAQIFRYVYTDEAAARGAEEGEHVNFQRQGGVHEVTQVDHEGVTLKHAKSGAEKRLTHDEFHAHLASAYRKEFDRGAEAIIRRYVAATKDGDPKAALGDYRERFKAAGVSPEHAKRLVSFLASRPGWHTDAKKALLTLASDPKVGKSIAPRAKQIARGAENLSRAEGSKQVEERHVGRAAVLRVPGGGFDEKLVDLRHRTSMELAHAEALLGAIEAASSNEAMKRLMVDHAQQAMKSDAGHELELMVTAYPGLRDVPEMQRLQSVRAKWQALQAERGAQRTPGKDGIQGAATTVYVSDADGNPTPQKARYRLVEADAATASHDPVKGFVVRKDYPEGVQERQYHRDRAEQEKVRRNAQGLKPAYIVNTNPDAVNGPPVMTSDGIVLGGNSRTMSLQLAYHDHPETAQAYREYLREHAHEFGLAHTDIDGFKAPILVREVEVEDQGKANLGVLVRRYNESFTQGMDPRVDQVARGRMVTQGMLDSVASGMGRTNDSGEPLYSTLKEFLGSSDGMRFVSDLSSSREGKAIIDRRNRSQYVGKDGKLNEDGKTFVERVLVGHVIPDPDLLSDMLPKHVSAIAGVVPHVVSAASKGHDVKAALKTAMDAHAYMRRKQLSDVAEYERDSGGFGALGVEGFEQKPKLDATAKGLLGVLVDRFDKPAQLASFFREFAKQARANPAGQASMFGESLDTATILGQAAGRSKAGQADMFSKAVRWLAHKIYSVPAGSLELPEDYGAALYDRLEKAGSHKYVKRVPTGKFTKTGRPRYRYYYHAAAGGGVHAHEHMVVGAGFKADGGHWHIKATDGEHVEVEHDETGEKRRMTRAELGAKLRGEHEASLAAHAERQAKEREEVKQYGTAKQKERLGVKDEPKRADPADAPKVATIDGRIEAVGDHIWGSRRDLATKRNIESSADLEDMSYADAAAIVSKARLVTPLTLEDAKAMGMSPGAAHLFIGLLAAVRQKPDDSKAGRAAYVDEIRSIQGAMLKVKTVADFKAMLREMRDRRRSAPPRVVVETMDANADHRERLVQLKKDEPGVDFKAYQRGVSGPITIERPAPLPYDSLGSRFATTIDPPHTSSKIKSDWRNTLGRAEALEHLQSLDGKGGWDWLEASTEKAKAETEAVAKPKAKPAANTERGFSDAMDQQSTTARRVGGKAVPDANPKRVKDTFNLREVDYGQASYMTQADREYHTKALEGALHDLADVMGVQPDTISFQGRLGIAMGARGRNGHAAAHYEPGRGAINLTKFMGGGTLAHEWGHALDNIIAGHFIKGGKGSATGDAFLTQSPEHSALPAELSQHVRAVMDAMNNHPDPARARAAHAIEVGRLRGVEDGLISKNNALVREHQAAQRIPATTEARDRIIAHKQQQIAQFKKEIGEFAAAKITNTLATNRVADLKRMIRQADGEIESLRGPAGVRGPEVEARLESIKSELETLRGQINQAALARRAAEKVHPTSTEFRRKSALMDKGGKSYWSSPHEMFARAFETYVNDKLKAQGRENTYLVRPHVASHPYPEGEEKQKIHAAMDRLFAHLAKSGDLHKALQRLAGVPSLGASPAHANVTPMKLTWDKLKAFATQLRKARAEPQHLWCELDEAFGERLWGTVIAKGVKPRTTDGAETVALPWMVGAAFDPAGIFKARSAKYVKRVPTGKFTKTGKPRYRYYYAIQHGGGIHNKDHFQEGASFAHGDGGHYTIHGAKDGKLTVSHSSMPEHRTEMTHVELADRLAGHHKAALDKHHAKLAQEHKDALEAGNEKGAQRIRDEAAKTGHKIDGHDKQEQFALSKLQHADDYERAQWQSRAKDNHDEEIAHAKSRIKHLGGLADGEDVARDMRDEHHEAIDFHEGVKKLKARGAMPTPEGQRQAANDNARGARDDIDWSGGGKGETPPPARKPNANAPREKVEHSLDKTSSNMSSIAWTPNKSGDGKGTMRTRFKNGSEYEHADVNHDHYEAVRRGDVDGSHGRAFNTLIKDKHQSRRIMAGAKGETHIGTETKEERERKERIKARADADAAKQASKPENKVGGAPAWPTDVHDSAIKEAGWAAKRAMPHEIVTKVESALRAMQLSAHDLKQSRLHDDQRAGASSGGVESSFHKNLGTKHEQHIADIAEVRALGAKNGKLHHVDALIAYNGGLPDLTPSARSVSHDSRQQAEDLAWKEKLAPKKAEAEKSDRRHYEHAVSIGDEKAADVYARKIRDSHGDPSVFNERVRRDQAANAQAAFDDARPGRHVDAMASAIERLKEAGVDTTSHEKELADLRKPSVGPIEQTAKRAAELNERVRALHPMDRLRLEEHLGFDPEVIESRAAHLRMSESERAEHAAEVGKVEAALDSGVHKRKQVEPAKPQSAPDHLADATKLYGLKDKDVDHIKRSGYHQKALEHAAAGDNDKARDHVRLAVKERLTRDPERNMSASGAERHMRDREKAAKLRKALHIVGVALRSKQSAA